ncbi:MAG: OmpA family protein [Ekhidna sp.]
MLRKLITSNLLVCLLLLFQYSISAQSLDKVNNGTIVMQPKVSFDETKMVLIANYYGSLRPYISTFESDSNSWSTPEAIFSSEITSQYDIRYPQLNFDNSKIYFSAKKTGKEDFDIYFSIRESGEWSMPEEVPMNINSSVDELAPAVSADEKKILFSRPMPEEAKADEYCKEIYISELTETGEWTEAIPLPPAYNTGCLCAPYFSRDNKSFFYSSYAEVNGSDGKRISKNQFNLFWAKIDGLFKYNPKPLVSEIGDEDLVSFSLGRDSTIFFAEGKFDKGEKNLESQVRSSTLNKSFIPSDMTLLTGTVLDKTGQPLSASVEVINPYTTKVFQAAPSNESGYFQIFVPQGEQYSVLALKEAYSAQSNLIETNQNNIVVDFTLFPEVDITFNVFDQDYFFPLDANWNLYDSSFNIINETPRSSGEASKVSLGEELNIIFSAENYFSDTLNLPFDKEVIFDVFNFDIELKRKLKDVALSFTDEDGNNLGLEITVFNVTRNEKTKRIVKDGSISLQLRDGEVYEISTSAQGYSYYKAELDLTKDEPVEEVEASLQSVENVSLVLNDITFEYNSYILTANSYIELDNLVAYLQSNEQYRVEISAHTDNSGPDDYNLKLSNLRATAVLQYLQDNSINKDRLVAVGFGESKPIFPNDTEENMAKNRRVEFKILTSE